MKILKAICLCTLSLLFAISSCNKPTPDPGPAPGPDPIPTPTPEPTPEIFTLQAVDLGVSVLWADRNLGAADVADLGNFYAWGETEPKDNYDWSTYKWANGSQSSITKYNTRSEYGSVDDIFRLMPEDDAAVVATDGVWRMPTRAEFEELLNNCQWEKSKKTTSDGVEIFGYQVTGNSGGNVIFLPAAGCIIGTEPNKRGEYGLYPTSDLCTAENNYYGYGDYYCWYFFFQSGERIIYGDSRARGWTIRPVKSKPQK